MAVLGARMMMPVWYTLLLVLGTAVFLGLAHALAWRLLRVLTATLSRLPSLRHARAWTQTRPVRAWFRIRHPRLYKTLAARLRPRPFTSLPLTLLALGALYLAALLGGLAEEVLEANRVLHLDQVVNAFFTSWREQPLIAAFLWITALGYGSTLAAVAGTATLFLWADRRPGFILPLWVVFLGTEVTTWAGKFAIDRHRPKFIAAASAASPSFPSAHAAGSMAVYGFLAYALARDLPGRRERFEVAFWITVLIAAIGFSRIFLSVHYATDVLAGFMVGGFWLLVGFVRSEWLRDDTRV